MFSTHTTKGLLVAVGLTLTACGGGHANSTPASSTVPSASTTVSVATDSSVSSTTLDSSATTTLGSNGIDTTAVDQTISDLSSSLNAVDSSISAAQATETEGNPTA
jgi:hypothetical protein